MPLRYVLFPYLKWCRKIYILFCRWYRRQASHGNGCICNHMRENLLFRRCLVRMIIFFSFFSLHFSYIPLLYNWNIIISSYPASWCACVSIPSRSRAAFLCDTRTLIYLNGCLSCCLTTAEIANFTEYIHFYGFNLNIYVHVPKFSISLGCTRSLKLVPFTRLWRYEVLRNIPERYRNSANYFGRIINWRWHCVVK